MLGGGCYADLEDPPPSTSGWPVQQHFGAVLPVRRRSHPALSGDVERTNLWAAAESSLDVAAIRPWLEMFARRRNLAVLAVLATALVASAAFIRRPRQSTSSDVALPVRALSAACTGSGPVVINEVVPDPSGSDKEWVEVYNPTPTSLDASGWRLVERAGSAGKWVSSTIPACSYAIVEFSRKLNNGGDTLTLLDESGSAVDEFEYTSSADGKSWARQPDGGAWGPEPQSPSKGMPNPAGPCGDGGGAVAINEVLPSPDDGGKEWVELYNPAATSVDASDWRLVDKVGNAGTWTASAIPACSYAIVEFSNKLNNGGDKVTLLDGSGAVVDEFLYASSVKGRSWARQPDGGAWGAEPQISSRGAPNPAAPSTDDGGRGCGQCEDGICFGSWNIQNFGPSKGGRPAVMAALRFVVGRYDVAAIQELSQKPKAPFVCGENTESTICATRPSVDGYTVAASPRIGDEQYAVILRDAAARAVGGATYPDGAGVHSRPPHAFEIEIAGEAPWRLVLALTHTKPTSAEAEIHNFPDVLSWMNSSHGSRGDSRLAVVGDFNADGSYFNEEAEWPDSQLGPEWAGYSLLVDNDLDTTVAANDYTYDRLIADNKLAGKAGPASAFILEDMDLSEVYSEGCRDGYVPSSVCQQSIEGMAWADVPPGVKMSLAKELSDHNPIEICLRG